MTQLSEQPWTLSSDELSTLVEGLQSQIGAMSTRQILDDETVLPLLAKLKTLMNEGGTVNVVPF